MKTTKRDVLDELDAIVADLFAKADGYLLSAKAYNCRSTEAIKSGLIKGAAVMRVNAERIQALIAKHRETSSGKASTAGSAPAALATETRPVEQVSADSEARDGQGEAGAEPPHQAQGSLDVRGLPSDHDGAGSGPQGPAE